MRYGAVEQASFARESARLPRQIPGHVLIKINIALAVNRDLQRSGFPWFKRPLVAINIDRADSYIRRCLVVKRNKQCNKDLSAASAARVGKVVRPDMALNRIGAWFDRGLPVETGNRNDEQVAARSRGSEAVRYPSGCMARQHENGLCIHVRRRFPG